MGEGSERDRLDVQQGDEPVARGVQHMPVVIARTHRVDPGGGLGDDHALVLRLARLARVEAPDHAVLVAPVHRGGRL